MAIFYIARRAPKLRYYGDVIYILILLEISRRTQWWCLKCVIVYLARDIRPFVMYCVNGKPRSSLLIESTDSMIIIGLVQMLNEMQESIIRVYTIFLALHTYL